MSRLRGTHAVIYCLLFIEQYFMILIFKKNLKVDELNVLNISQEKLSKFSGVLVVYH